MKLAPKRHSLWRGFFSTKYIKSHYTEAVQGSSSFATIENDTRDEVIATINDYWIARMKKTKLFLLLFLPYYFGWYAAILITLNSYVMTIGILPILAALIVFTIKMSRSNREGDAADQLLHVITVLEHNPNRWRSSEFRWDIARRLELAAKGVERIPLGIKSVAPGIKQEMVESGRIKAQAIRELQLWAIRPDGPTVLRDLTGRLASDTIKIADGRWYELPEPEKFDHSSSRWTRIGAIIGSIVISTGGISVLVFSAKVGPASAFLAPLLFAAALALLSTSGIPSGIVERYAGMANKLSAK